MGKSAISPPPPPPPKEEETAGGGGALGGSSFYGGGGGGGRGLDPPPLRRFPQVDPAQEYGGQGQGKQLRDGERPADGRQTADPGEQKTHRKQDCQLAHRRYQKAEHPMSQSLKHRGAHNGIAREQEAEGDDPQGRDADRQQIAGVVLRPEQIQQDMGGQTGRPINRPA